MRYKKNKHNDIETVGPRPSPRSATPCLAPKVHLTRTLSNVRPKPTRTDREPGGLPGAFPNLLAQTAFPGHRGRHVDPRSRRNQHRGELWRRPLSFASTNPTASSSRHGGNTCPGPISPTGGPDPLIRARPLLEATSTGRGAISRVRWRAGPREMVGVRPPGTLTAIVVSPEIPVAGAEIAALVRNANRRA